MIAIAEPEPQIPADARHERVVKRTNAQQTMDFGPGRAFASVIVKLDSKLQQNRITYRLVRTIRRTGLLEHILIEG